MRDVAYIVRPGDNNDELRYSLRTLANLPHHRVWIAGHKPAWVTGVEHIPTVQGADKWRNAWGNLRALAEHPDVGPDLVLMNDDFYILRPVDRVEHMHLGRLTEVLADRQRRHPSKVYTCSLERTLNYLRTRGAWEPNAYTAHVPMPLDRPRLLATLDEIESHAGTMSWRTVYGNTNKCGGRQIADVKVVRAGDRARVMSGRFASSLDSAWSLLAQDLARRFPTRSPYEVR